MAAIRKQTNKQTKIINRYHEQGTNEYLRWKCNLRKYVLSFFTEGSRSFR